MPFRIGLDVDALEFLELLQVLGIAPVRLVLRQSPVRCRPVHAAEMAHGPHEMAKPAMGSAGFMPELAAGLAHSFLLLAHRTHMPSCSATQSSRSSPAPSRCSRRPS